jgi:hypothetical protein
MMVSQQPIFMGNSHLRLQAVMSALTLWFPEELKESAANIPTATLASVYVSKLVKVPNYASAQVLMGKAMHGCRAVNNLCRYIVEA